MTGDLFARFKVAIGIPSGKKDELMGHPIVIHIDCASRIYWIFDAVHLKRNELGYEKRLVLDLKYSDLCGI